MKIITPTEIQDVAWEGRLQPLGGTFMEAERPPRVTIGEPKWWPAEQAMAGETGKTWTPPADGRRYTLLRLACTLHPPEERRTRYSEATLTAYLRPRQGAGTVVAHDLHPQRLLAEEKGSLKVGLGPDLKFANALEVSLLEVGAEIEYQQAYPIVQCFGLGEPRPYWRFSRHSSNPLLGSLFVYAVLDAPGDAGGVRLGVELVATIETRFGPIRVGMPEEERASVSRTIE
jgi:hypothetical protein